MLWLDISQEFAITVRGSAIENVPKVFVLVPNRSTVLYYSSCGILQFSFEFNLEIKEIPKDHAATDPPTIFYRNTRAYKGTTLLSLKTTAISCTIDGLILVLEY
jgi:hypothetical protein